MKFRYLASALAAFALCGAALPRSASANGSFPKVSQLVTDPSDPMHLALRSNFGLLITRDGGANWDLVCEAGMGYQNTQPPVAILGDGSLLVGLATGVAWADSKACNFTIGTGISTYVADVSRIPGTTNHGIAVTADVSADSSQVLQTADGGKSWTKFGVAIDGVIAATLDTAASDTTVTYVSGSARAATPTGVILRSSDGGKTWDQHGVPMTNAGSAPYIAAIAPDDANTVYVRTRGVPGTLLVTHDGGKTFQDVLDFTGPVEGLALSTDGKTVVASGRVDGVHRAPTKTLTFETLNCAKVSALAFAGDNLYSCANEAEAGYTVGSSSNQGQDFSPKLHLSCVRGILDCPSTSSVGSVCPAGWSATQNQLGGTCDSSGSFTPSTDCPKTGDAGTPDASTPADAGQSDAMVKPPGDAAVMPVKDASASDAATGQPVTPGTNGKSGGCGCSTAPNQNSLGAWLGLGFLLASVRLRRSRRAT